LHSWPGHTRIHPNRADNFPLVPARHDTRRSGTPLVIRTEKGTGLGSALIAEHVIVPLELGQLPYPGGDATLGEILGRQGLKRVGKRKWRKAISRVVPALMAAMLADYVVLGGGNAKRIKHPPGGSRLSNNLTAFRGGFRLWHLEDVQTLYGQDRPPTVSPEGTWRLIWCGLYGEGRSPSRRLESSQHVFRSAKLSDSAM
jgi:hypothetical protein